MKAFDVVQQLAAVLPAKSDMFTTNIAVTSITQTGGVATATTDVDHGLTAGEQTNIVGAQSVIAISTLTRAGTVGTMVTSTSHDYTHGVTPSVIIDEATEAEFNGTFTILSVPNRTTVTFTMEDAGAVTATGSPVCLNGTNAYNQYTGLREITSVPSTTTFQYTVPTTLVSPARGTIAARSNPRITAVVSEDIIIDAYTKQAANELVAFVVLGDVAASRSRRINSDAVDDIQRTQDYKQQIIQPVTVYVVVPSAVQNAAREARDLCEELLQPICQSLLFKAMPSYLSVSHKGPLQFIGHGFSAYNRAWYMHAYSFEQVVDMTFDDTVGYDVDVALRDIDLNMAIKPGNGVNILTATINLDEDFV